ncbi:HPr kinase/phosphatase C-terminal domain-containing protein [uncultured Sphingomonas sp.]|uniref:HPr kinase/phosphorylase n=1 Tax=uncultured Sphingomonas sp. TaxID=158754 RepID=UPI0026108AE6|nr:HPr kinase/phosphatase C-terminal domain-containing protein [uncultured Sphingomonas sp.]
MSDEPTSARVHATTVAIDGWGVMLVGASGAGKSDLALRLIDRGAVLVSDDYTDLAQRGDALIATPPPNIAGRMEIRGLGIVDQAFATSILIQLVVSLGDEIDRMPEPRWRTIAGVRVREIVIDPHPASAPIKVKRALKLFAMGDAA